MLAIGNEIRTANPVFIPRLSMGDLFRAEGDKHETPLGRIDPADGFGLRCRRRGATERVRPRRSGDITLVRAFRRNLALPEAANSALAKERWVKESDIDAWLIWNIWQVANSELAQLVELDEPFRIYRDAGVVLTERGTKSAQAKAFVEFLQSPTGAKIFAKWGWIAQ